MYLDKLRLDDRVAFVTGGAQGIGKAAAEALVEAGATVITGDLSGADIVLDVRDSNRVRVNAVAPTYINTPINAFADREGEMYRRWIDGTPMGRLGEADEVASVILFLASDASSLMTGSIVLADGGYSCW